MLCIDDIQIITSGQLQQLYESDEAAYKEVERGRAWGAMIFQNNYTDSLVERTEQGRYAEDYTIDASDIAVKLDMSSKYATHYST